ncbi:MAG: phosphate acyltransferase PlsX, partial [Sedimentisphaerales bacterium]|nr:phosphate acyltransferase PlsX [Sedimentisphaerales bacterium]
PRDVLEPRLSALKPTKAAVKMVDAPEVIGMDEPPVESLRKKPKSSIGVLSKLAKRGQVDSVISAGNTGACVAAFQMRMRNLRGVNRPGIAVVFPTFEGPVTICDVGANIACKPIHLYQYGVMGGVYSKHLLGIENPRVGIMSIGQEDAKGNEVVKKTRMLMKSDTKMNFVGNIEGRDIFRGICDVAVCDGFVGNVILKLTEGLVDGLFKAIRYEMMEEKAALAMEFKPVITNIYRKYDYNEYGGAPLLGVNGNALICHGASESRTIRNAILTSKRYYIEKINDKIAEYLSETSVRMVDGQTV